MKSTRPAEAPPEGGYTLCGNAAAEQRVTQDLSRIAAGLFSDAGHDMRALVLVGSFARGEGTIVIRDGEPHALPGYQLLALFDRRPQRHRALLHDSAATWTRILRTWVDVLPFAVADVARAPATLFWFHIGRGQRITLIGDPTAIRIAPERAPAELPVGEAVRTLAEATVAVALSNLDQDATLAHRIDSLHRLSLACGEAGLLLRGSYRDSMRARASLLGELDIVPGLAAAYRAAVAYRTDPRPVQRAWSDRRAVVRLREQLSEILLTLEHERTGSPIDPEAYARFKPNVPAEDRNAVRLLVARLARRSPPLHTPERLLRAAVALAFDHRNDAARTQAARLLGPSVHARSRSASARGAGPSDQLLFQGLRALAEETLADPVGRPFTHWRIDPERGLQQLHAPPPGLAEPA